MPNASVPGVPLALTVFYDVHCPYSDRVLAWLAALGRDVVAPTYRAFALEQVNHDPTATRWRIWEQPLDYPHYRGRPDRRALPAFLAITLAEQLAPTDAVDQFRLAVSNARHAGDHDVSALDRIVGLAGDTGIDADALRRLLADEDAVAGARDRLRDDWHEARRDYEIFGVPTLRLEGAAPFYLRLGRVPQDGQAEALLASVRGFGERLPQVLEIKVPERVARRDD